jgi:hypothetical protein
MPLRYDSPQTNWAAQLVLAAMALGTRTVLASAFLDDCPRRNCCHALRSSTYSPHPTIVCGLPSAAHRGREGAHGELRGTPVASVGRPNGIAPDTLKSVNWLVHAKMHRPFGILHHSLRASRVRTGIRGGINLSRISHKQSRLHIDNKL